jgi:NAD(P)H-dependent FMN reductase
MNQNDQGGNRVFVVGICGSIRRGSYTRMAVQIALQGAQEVGAQTRLIDLKDYHLVFCDGKENEDALPQDVFKLRREVSQAAGIILGTPEYHGSFSGLLKNALDLMGFDEIEGKMIGLVGVSGGALGAVHALNSLRTIGRALHAWVIPEQASIPEAYKAFDQSGTLKDSDLEKRVKEVGRQVARFAYLHTSEKAQEFLRAWEGAPLNPGGSKN